MEITSDQTTKWEVDHIKPKSEGGDNSIKNKQLLHRHCHDTKTALDNKTYTRPKLQDLPDEYLWVNDIMSGSIVCVKSERALLFKHLKDYQ